MNLRQLIEQMQHMPRPPVRIDYTYRRRRRSKRRDEDGVSPQMIVAGADQMRFGARQLAEE